MKKWLASLLSLLALGLVAVGCGDDDDEADKGGVQTTQPPADTGGAKPAGRTVQVRMRDIQFMPHDVKVKVGGTVKWTNADSTTHTVTKQGGPGAKFDSGNLEVGGTFEQKFDTPGKVNYVCTIHPNQTGTVTVE